VRLISCTYIRTSSFYDDYYATAALCWQKVRTTPMCAAGVFNSSTLRGSTSWQEQHARHERQV
jgi:hypothetical protein